jgi:hypothetical protein
MSSGPSPDAVVVGGGLIGSSIAYHLARAGVRTRLIEQGDLASGASGANFGNVQVKPGFSIDLNSIRRNNKLVLKHVTLRVVPRLTSDFDLSLREVRAMESIALKPGEEIVDTLHVEHRPVKAAAFEIAVKKPNTGLARFERRLKTPDLFGSYPTDPDTLPPGVAGRPMITIVNEVDGVPIGGVTYMITIEK